MKLKKSLFIAWASFRNVSSACNIPAEDLLAAARTLKKSTVHRPLIDTLNIENYVFKGGDDDAEIAMENKMKTEFEELVKSVNADFYELVFYVITCFTSAY